LRTGTQQAQNDVTHLQQEVTVRQRVEEELKVRKNSLNFGSCASGVFVIDANGKPYYANQTATDTCRESNRSHSRSIKRNLSSLSGGDGCTPLSISIGW